MNDLILNNNSTQLFTPDEYELLNTRKSPAIPNYSYDSCKTALKIISLNDEYKVYVDDNETTLIKQVFSKNVDDDTLVVISYKEHPSVDMCAYCCKNLLVLNENDIDTLNVDKIINTYNKLKLKKIFVAIIGTSFCYGCWTPDTLFIKIREKTKDIPCRIMVDDAQSLFAINRCYRLFDYILSTGHVLIKNFDMGILITNHIEEDYGKDAYNWMEEYLQRLDIMIPKLKMYNFEFNTRMKDLFSLVLSTGKVSVIQTVPHVFCLKVNGKCDFTEEEIEILKDKYYILVFDQNKPEDFTIRIRVADVLQSSKFRDGIIYLMSLLCRKYPELSYYDNKRLENG